MWVEMIGAILCSAFVGVVAAGMLRGKHATKIDSDTRIMEAKIARLITEVNKVVHYGSSGVK